MEAARKAASVSSSASVCLWTYTSYLSYEYEAGKVMKLFNEYSVPINHMAYVKVRIMDMLIGAAIMLVITLIAWIFGG